MTGPSSRHAARERSTGRGWLPTSSHAGFLPQSSHQPDDVSRTPVADACLAMQRPTSHTIFAKLVTDTLRGLRADAGAGSRNDGCLAFLTSTDVSAQAIRDTGRSRTGQRQFCGLPPAPARSVPCALPGGFEPPIPPPESGVVSAGPWKHGGRGEIRTPTAEAAALRAACLTGEQPAPGVPYRNRTVLQVPRTCAFARRPMAQVCPAGLEPAASGM